MAASPALRARSVALALALAATALPASAAVLRLCDATDRGNAVQRDRQLRFAAVVREHLEASGAEVALVSRAGLSLGRFGMRYSHAGFSLRSPADPATPAWAVRQLYYDCEPGRPRLFDQGLSAFVLGAEQPEAGWLSVLLLPPQAAAALARAVADDRLALRMLHPRYSANAHAWALQFQNCNQWVAEMLAAAWGGDAVRGPTAPDEDAPAPTPAPAPAPTADLALRQRAQHWLAAEGYVPAVFELRSPLLQLAGLFVPWIHQQDHPPQDLEAMRYRVSMPAAIEAFVRRRWAATRRLEFCYSPLGIVVREDGPPLDAACTAGPGDQTLAF